MTKLTDARKALRVYHAAHQAVRADLERIHEYLSRSPEARRASLKEFATWFAHHAEMIAIHDVSEHEYFFPKLQQHNPGMADFSTFLKDQSEVADEARKQVSMLLVKGEESSVAQALQLYVQAMQKRLDDEETMYVPLIMQYYTAEEYEKVERSSLTFAALMRIPISMPWMLSRLPPAEKSDVLQAVPVVVRWLYQYWWEPRYLKRYRF